MKPAQMIVSAMALSLAISAYLNAADNKVVVHTITEERKSVLLDKEHAFPSMGLQLKAQISGPDVPATRKYGNVKITKATDDTGTDLTKAPEDAMMMSSDTLQEQSWQFDADEKDHKFFNFDIRLPALPARKATSVKLIEGTIDLVAGGEEKVIEVKEIAKHYGKPLEDESLKKSNVEITLIEPGKGGGMFEMNGLTAKIKGDASAIKIEIQDANGENLSNGTMSSTDNDVLDITYMTEGKLPATAKLKITSWPGQKKISVPFKLENIVLP